MANERKKVEKKEVVKPQPKKRVEPIKVVTQPKTKPIAKKVEVPKPIEVVEQPLLRVSEPKPKAKKQDIKYFRIAEDAPMDDRRLVGEKVQKGELQFAYYATDNDKGYHYYEINKN